jgi:hypothetical protein
VVNAFRMLRPAFIVWWHAIGAVAIFEGGDRSGHKSRRRLTGLYNGGPCDLDCAVGQLKGLIRPAGIGKRPAMDTEGIRRQDLGTRRQVIQMDVLKDAPSGILEQGIGRPKRQAGIDTPAGQLGTGGAIQDDRCRLGETGEKVHGAEIISHVTDVTIYA